VLMYILSWNYGYTFFLINCIFNLITLYNHLVLTLKF
jgi:hypothetical protein